MVKNGTLNPGQRPELRTVAGLRASRAHTDSKAHYPAGWYNSSIEVDPALDTSYRPTEDAVLTGAVDISRKRWPGVETYRPERGARLTTPFPPAPMPADLLDELPVRSA